MSILENRDTMSCQVRMKALIEGKTPDRVPFSPFALGFAAKAVGMDLGEFYRHPEKAFNAGLKLMKIYPWMNTRPTYGWAERGAWEFGGEITWPDNDRYPAPISHQSVITRPEQVQELEDPDPFVAGMNPLVARFNELSRRHEFPASLPGGTPTTITSCVLGTSNFLKWTRRYPDAVHAMQRKATDFIIKSAEKTIAIHGIKNCSVFSGLPLESNQLISSEMFRSFCKPYIKEIFTFYRREGLDSVMIHLCGNHTLNLSHWKDIPLPDRTIFSIGHEMDIPKTSEQLGAKYILAGNLDNSILQAGTPDDVYRDVQRSLTLGMKHPGGFLLMPSCEFPPFTPRQNVEIIELALADHGFY
ncbi:MAG: uroporphyrinogen decarboxylase family protein [Desulforhopalus sp.]